LAPGHLRNRWLIFGWFWHPTVLFKSVLGNG
jgi:hypothetical protein